MSLNGILAYLYPGIDLLNSVKLQDDGAGPYIAKWNDPRPQPTQADIDAAAIPAQAAADAAAAVLAQEKLDRDELKSRFVSIRDGLNTIIATASFTNATRDAAIIELAKDVRFVLRAVKGLM